MDWKKMVDELWDVLKGAIGAAVSIAAVTFLQYLGTHIPDIVSMATHAASGVAAIKVMRHV